MKRVLFTNAINSINFYDQISTTDEDTIILAEKKWWSTLRSWDKQGKIHLGLRGAGWKMVKNLPFISIKYNNHITRIIINNDITEATNICNDIESGKYNVDNIINNVSRKIILPQEISQEILDSLGSGNIGFDFETNAVSPMTPNFLPMGLSLCNEHGEGFYVEMRWDRDYMGDSYKLLREFIISNQSRLITYNCKFEMSCVATIWKTIIYPKDAMVLCVMDNMYSNLKLNSQYYLHTPSWDDEMEEESILWNEYNSTKDQSILDQIIERRSVKDNLDKQIVADTYNKILADPLLNSNPWSECYPETVGHYCIIDSYYTVLIYNILIKKYLETSEIFLQNFYMGSLFNLFPFHISTKRLDILHKESNNIYRSICLYKLRYYYELLKERLSSYDFSQLSQYAINVIKFDQSLIELDNTKILKSIVKSVNNSNPNSLQSTLKSIYGNYGDIIYNTIINSGKPIDKLLRARNIWIDLASNITEDLSKLIYNHNKSQLSKYSKQLASFNGEVDSLRKKYDIIYANNDGLLNEAIYRIHWQKLKDKVYLKYIYDYEMINKCKKEIKSLMNKWSENIAVDKTGMDTRNDIDLRNFEIIKLCSKHIDVESVKNHLSDYNILKWLPTSFYAINNDILSFESIVDYIKLSQYEDEFKKLDNVTIYDDTSCINIPVDAVNLKTADQGFNFIDNFARKYYTTIKELSNMFILSNCLKVDDESLKTYADGILKDFNTKSEYLSDILFRSGYDFIGEDGTDSSLTMITAYNNIRIRDKEITSKFDIDLYPHSSDKLTIDTNNIVCFARFVNYLMIQAFANKQLTTYIPHYYVDSYELVDKGEYGMILKNREQIFIASNSDGEEDDDEKDDEDE